MRAQIEAHRARYDRERRKKAGQLALEKSPQWKRAPRMMKGEEE
jgi:hypothetical protein